MLTLFLYACGVSLIVALVVLVLIIISQQYEVVSMFAPWATLALAIVAVWAIMNNRDTRIKEKKQHLLKEIVDWGLDVQTSMVGVEYPYDVDIVGNKEVIRSIEYNILQRQSGLFAKSAYILSLAKKSFENDLDKVVQKIIDAYCPIIFLRCKEVSTSKLENIFDKEYCDAMAAIDVKRSKNGISYEDWVAGYSKDLVLSIRALFNKAVDIMDDL